MTEGHFRLQGRFRIAHGRTTAKCKGLLCVWCPEQTGWMSIKPEWITLTVGVYFFHAGPYHPLNQHTLFWGEWPILKQAWLQMLHSKWWLSPLSPFFAPSGKCAVEPYSLSSNSTSGKYPEVTVTVVLKDSFTITKHWTQTTSPQLRGWSSKSWCIHSLGTWTISKPMLQRTIY